MRTLRAGKQAAPVELVPGGRDGSTMIITIDDDTRIDATDGLSFTLMRRTVVNDINPTTGKPTKHAGAVRWTVEGYHGSLTSAALSALQRRFMTGDREVDVRALIAELRAASERIAKACQRVPENLKSRVLPDDLPALQRLIARATDEETKRRKSV